MAPGGLSLLTSHIFLCGFTPDVVTDGGEVVVTEAKTVANGVKATINDLILPEKEEILPKCGNLVVLFSRFFLRLSV
jgi:hypothetical protein